MTTYENECPVHQRPMLQTDTQWGSRFQCQEKGCTMARWGGSTSTPADAETRQARQRCHEAFDPLWKKRTRFNNRNAAYRWLRHAMRLPKDKAHIGMFDLEQCQELLRIIKRAEA